MVSFAPVSFGCTQVQAPPDDPQPNAIRKCRLRAVSSGSWQLSRRGSLILPLCPQSRHQVDLRSPLSYRKWSGAYAMNDPPIATHLATPYSKLGLCPYTASKFKHQSCYPTPAIASQQHLSLESVSIGTFGQTGLGQEGRIFVGLVSVQREDGSLPACTSS